MNKIVKRLIPFLIEAVAMTILLVGIKIFANGMYLLGLDGIEEYQPEKEELRAIIDK